MSQEKPRKVRSFGELGQYKDQFPQKQMQQQSGDSTPQAAPEESPKEDSMTEEELLVKLEGLQVGNPDVQKNVDEFLAFADAHEQDGSAVTAKYAELFGALPDPQKDAFKSAVVAAGWEVTERVIDDPEEAPVLGKTFKEMKAALGDPAGKVAGISYWIHPDGRAVMLSAGSKENRHPEFWGEGGFRQIQGVFYEYKDGAFRKMTKEEAEERRKAIQNAPQKRVKKRAHKRGSKEKVAPTGGDIRVTEAPAALVEKFGKPDGKVGSMFYWVQPSGDVRLMSEGSSEGRSVALWSEGNSGKIDDNYYQYKNGKFKKLRKKQALASQDAVSKSSRFKRAFEKLEKLRRDGSPKADRVAMASSGLNDEESGEFSDLVAGREKELNEQKKTEKAQAKSAENKVESAQENRAEESDDNERKEQRSFKEMHRIFNKKKREGLKTGPAFKAAVEGQALDKARKFKKELEEDGESHGLLEGAMRELEQKNKKEKSGKNQEKNDRFEERLQEELDQIRNGKPREDVRSRENNFDSSDDFESKLQEELAAIMARP